jgi:hypothetical protein
VWSEHHRDSSTSTSTSTISSGGTSNPSQSAAAAPPSKALVIFRSPTAVRASCGACGTPLFMKMHCCPGQTDVPVAIFDPECVGDGGDGDSVAAPSYHIFVAQKAAWYAMPDDGCARYERFSPGHEELLREWEEGGRRERADVPRAEAGDVRVD